MDLIKYWCIREDQWGSDLIEIRNGTEVYNTYEDRKDGGCGERYLGNLQEFVQNYTSREEKAYQEAVAYIRKYYLKQ